MNMAFNFQKDDRIMVVFLLPSLFHFGFGTSHGIRNIGKHYNFPESFDGGVAYRSRVS